MNNLYDGILKKTHICLHYCRCCSSDRT